MTITIYNHKQKLHILVTSLCFKKPYELKNFKTEKNFHFDFLSSIIVSFKMELSYRSYQKVLNISLKPKQLTPVPKATAAATTKKSPNQSVTKLKSNAELKTGCLTCRKRKKKCDEDKVNGKCQACTRNFLDCCWPDPNTIKTKNTKPQQQAQQSTQVKPQISPVVRPKKCDINYLLHSQPEPSTPVATVVATQPKVHIPYQVPHYLLYLLKASLIARLVHLLCLQSIVQTTNFKLKTVM